MMETVLEQASENPQDYLIYTVCEGFSIAFAKCLRRAWKGKV